MSYESHNYQIQKYFNMTCLGFHFKRGHNLKLLLSRPNFSLFTSKGTLFPCIGQISCHKTLYNWYLLVTITLQRQNSKSTQSTLLIRPLLFSDHSLNVTMHFSMQTVRRPLARCNQRPLVSFPLLHNASINTTTIEMKANLAIHTYQ